MKEIKPIVLLVEDNEGDILLTTEALQEYGISDSITVVKDGYDAILYLEKKGRFSGAVQPDLILLDINLPKINGHEVLKTIKENPKLCAIPVVVFTTSNNDKDIRLISGFHATAYLTKPLEVNGFAETMALINKFYLAADSKSELK